MAALIPLPKLIDQLSQLVKAQGAALYACSIANGLAVGRHPASLTHLVDFASESVRPLTKSEAMSDPIPMVSPPDFSTSYRRRAAFFFDLRGVREGCVSLKHLLAESLRAIEAAAPGTLEKLSQIKPRSRRIVARDKGELFDEIHLAERYAEPLMEGWWFGTNNSADGTKAWLERACGCAGLTWGKDFKTNLGQQT
ncbi:MAG: hypothetical protein ACKVP3_12585 [Hyphomicrobiaceae bacterium]